MDKLHLPKLGRNHTDGGIDYGKLIPAY